MRKTPITDYFLTAIESIRKDKRLSQAQVAEIAGMTPQALSRIMNGGRAPKAETQERIAKALGFSLADFLEIGRSRARGVVEIAVQPVVESTVELLQQIADLSRRLAKKDDEIEALKAKVLRLEAAKPKPARRKVPADDFPVSDVNIVNGGESIDTRSNKA